MRNFRKFLAFTLAVLMIASTVITVSASSNFVDVTATDDYAAEINHLADLGILDITSELNTFNSADKVQRYRLAVWLAALESGIVNAETWADETNTTIFTDLTKYQAAISYVTSAGIMPGKTATEFAPNEYVTLAEACGTILALLGQKGAVDYDPTSGPDAWKWAYVKAAKDLGIIDLDTFLGKYSPDYQITRGDAAYLLMNALYTERNDGTTIAKDVFGLSETAHPNTQTLQLVATEAAALWGEKTSAGFVKFAALNEDGTYEAPIVVSVDVVDEFEGKTADEYSLYIGSLYNVITNDDATVVTACTRISEVKVHTSGITANGNVITVDGNNYSLDGENDSNVIAFIQNGLSSVVVNGASSTAKYNRSVKCTFDSTNGEPVWYDANGELARGIYYGEDMDGDGNRDLVADYIGGRFYIGAENEIVLEIVADTNGVGYYGVVMAGQWGRDQNGNVSIYRYATDADWANVEVITTSTTEVAYYAPVDYVDVVEKLALPANQITYTIVSVDLDADGIIDVLYLVDIATYEIGKIEAGSFLGKPYDKIENLDGSEVTALVGDYALACVNGTTLIIKELYPLLFGQYDANSNKFSGVEYTDVDTTYNTTNATLDDGDFALGVVIGGKLYIEAVYDVETSIINEITAGKTFANNVFETVVDVNENVEKVSGIVVNDVVKGALVNNRFTGGKDALYVLEHYPLWTGRYNENDGKISFDVLKTAAANGTAAEYTTYEIKEAQLLDFTATLENGDYVQAYVIEGVLYVAVVNDLKVGEITADNTHAFFDGVEFMNTVNEKLDGKNISFTKGGFLYGVLVEGLRNELGYFDGISLIVVDQYTFTVEEVIINDGTTTFGGVEVAGTVEITDGVTKNLTSGDYALAFIAHGKLWIKEVYDLVIGDITVDAGKVSFNGTPVEKIDYLATLTEVVENGDKALAVLENGNLHVKAIYKFTHADYTVVDNTIKFGETVVTTVTPEAGVVDPADGDFVYATVINGELIVRRVYKYTVAEYDLNNGTHSYLDVNTGRVIDTAKTLENVSGSELKDGDYVLALVYNDVLRVKKVYPVQTGEIVGYEDVVATTGKVIIKVDGGFDTKFTWADNRFTTLLTEADTVDERTALVTRYITFIAAEGEILKISERLVENPDTNGLVGSVAVSGNQAVVKIHQESGATLDITVADVLRNIYRYPSNNVFNYQEGIINATNLGFDWTEFAAGQGKIDFASLKWAATSTVREQDAYIREISVPTNVTPIEVGEYEYTVTAEGIVDIATLTVYQLLTFVSDGKGAYDALVGQQTAISGLSADTKLYLYTPVENGEHPYFAVSEYTVGDFTTDDLYDIAGSIKVVTVFQYGDSVIAIGQDAEKHDATVPVNYVAVIPADTKWDLSYRIDSEDGRIYAIYTTQTDIFQHITGRNLGKVIQVYEVDTIGEIPAELVWDVNHELYNVTISDCRIIDKYIPAP